MSMSKYKICFWNYEKIGKISAAHAVRDWKDAGMNFAMSFEYNSACDKPELMLELLDECLANGIQLIICDKRFRFETYAQVGESAFRKGVQEAVKEFGSHNATYAFHVGDEPNKDTWEAARAAFKIVQEESNGKKAFINMYPTWTTPDFEDLLGMTIPEYMEALTEFIIDTKAEMLSFDCYSQCTYSDKAAGIDNFIRNLRLYSEVAKKTGVELFVSILSVGHWNMRVPTQDDIRWQVNICVAHGASGLFWFYFYQRYLEDNYREGPINCFGERTATYDKISFQNRFFALNYAQRLEALTHEKVSYFGGDFGGCERFEEDEELRSLQTEVNECPICVTRWRNAEGKACYSFVNASQEFPTRLVLDFKGWLSANNGKRWLAPGQILIVDEHGIV